MATPTTKVSLNGVQRRLPQQRLQAVIQVCHIGQVHDVIIRICRTTRARRIVLSVTMCISLAYHGSSGSDDDGDDDNDNDGTKSNYFALNKS